MSADPRTAISAEDFLEDFVAALEAQISHNHTVHQFLELLRDDLARHHRAIEAITETLDRHYTASETDERFATLSDVDSLRAEMLSLTGGNNA